MIRLKNILKEGYFKSGKKDDITSQKYTDDGKENGWPFPMSTLMYELKSFKNTWDGWRDGPVKNNTPSYGNEPWSKSEIKAAQKLLKTEVDKWFKKNIK